MSKRRNIFKDVVRDTPSVRESLFKQAYRLETVNGCVAKDHKNNKLNPWCLHNLGQSRWAVKEDVSKECNLDREKFLGMYSGLKNLGATCYLNSLLQILYNDPPFRRALFSYTPSKEGDVNRVIRLLQQLMVDLEASKRGVIDPSLLVTTLKLPTIEQQDAVEFGELLFGMLNGTIPSLQDHMKGSARYLTSCLSCTITSSRQSDFTDLKLQVQPKTLSILERVAELGRVEVLDGENSLRCSACNTLSRVERSYVISELPSTLQLQLLRFTYNSTTYQSVKDTSYVKFTETLQFPGIAPYRLRGMILHVGKSKESGHYVAVIRGAGDNWILYNDDQVSEMESLDLKAYDLCKGRRPQCAPGEHCSQAVYLLVYTRGGEEEGHVTPPAALLERTAADNEEFITLKTLLEEQREEEKQVKEQKRKRMEELCNLLPASSPEDSSPVPLTLLEKWISTGTLPAIHVPEKKKEEETLPEEAKLEEAKLEEPFERMDETEDDFPLVVNDTKTPLVNGETENKPTIESPPVINLDEFVPKEEACEPTTKGHPPPINADTSDVFCCHGNLSYQKLAQIKYISRAAFQAILAPASFQLCRECVGEGLRQHLFDLSLEEDFKTMGRRCAASAIGEEETLWWVVKDDFRAFRKIVRSGAPFNADAKCTHGKLYPTSNMKLVPKSVLPLIRKYIHVEFPYFEEFHPECEVCLEECDSEHSHVLSLLAVRRSLGRLLNDSTFPYIDNLTTHIVPLQFIMRDLRQLFRLKVPIAKLDLTWMFCEHEILASDAPEIAAFLKTNEWELLSTNFGPADPITCISETEFSVARCSTCLAKRPPFTDKFIYVREDRGAQKRRRKTDIKLLVSSHDTVFDVKVKLCEQLAIAPSDQVISTKSGKVLEEGRIGDLGIEPETLLFLEPSTTTGEGGVDHVTGSEQERGFTGTFLTQYNGV